MSTLFLLLILLLGFLITFQIAKASEYVGVLKGEKKNFEQHNRINGFLMIVFLVLGLIGTFFFLFSVSRVELYFGAALLAGGLILGALTRLWSRPAMQ